MGRKGGAGRSAAGTSTVAPDWEGRALTCQPLDCRVERPTLGDRPALEEAVGLQAEIVMQDQLAVFLHDEDRKLVGLLSPGARWFARLS